MEQVWKTIAEQRLFAKGAKIVVGLSGGPDSACLFHLLCQMREEWELGLYAVHVNHRLRPGAAEEDQQYVEALCRQSGVPCRVFVRDCAAAARERGISLEEAGRELRYEAFYEAAAELAAGEQRRGAAGGDAAALGAAGRPVKIAVAHNADDQAETILFRLLRGTGTDGLAGMEYRRPGRDGTEVVRPLLDVRRSQIEAYCRQHGLTPRRDATNEEAVYTRNKIRLELLPYLQENYNEQVVGALLRLSRVAREDKRHLWREAQEAFSQALVREEAAGQDAGSVALGCRLLASLDPAVRRRVILLALRRIGLCRDVAEAQLAAADRLVSLGRAGGEAVFPHGYRLRLDAGRAVFRRGGETPPPAPPPASAPAFLARVVPRARWEAEGLPADLLTRGFCRAGGRLLAAFDYAAFAAAYPAPFLPELRTRQPGDWIRLQGLGRKKIQDLFVDCKVPRERRAQIWLAAAGSEILWIAGDGGGLLSGGAAEQAKPGETRGRITGNYRVAEHAEMILLLELSDGLW